MLKFLWHVFVLLSVHTLIATSEFVDPNEPYSTIDDDIVVQTSPSDEVSIVKPVELTFDDDTEEFLVVTDDDLSNVSDGDAVSEDVDFWAFLKSCQSFLTKIALVISLLKALQRCCKGLWELIFGSRKRSRTSTEEPSTRRRSPSPDEDVRRRRRDQLKLPIQLAKEFIKSECDELGVSNIRY